MIKAKENLKFQDKLEVMLTMNKKKLKVVFSFVAALFIALIIWIAWGNRALELNTYIISSTRLPKEFSGYRIAHISDLHNAEMGENNEKLLKMIQNAKPDIIVMTGDLIDSENTDVTIALHFAEEAVKIAPCYYVTGNHEARKSEAFYLDFESKLIDAGIGVLHDSEVIIEENGASISIIGIDDPNYSEAFGGGIGNSMAPECISGLATIDGFTILLSHRPEFFKQYVRANIDLVLSGHAHGGQFRLPFVGGLVAPNQGLFPEYDQGYTQKKIQI